MKRVNKIIQHPLYQVHFQNLQETEKTRIFCNHTMEHFLDVARLMYIYNLEQNANLEKEVIYAAALLHDVGRDLQNRFEIPHDEASAELAAKILPQCDYTNEEIQMITSAILKHRDRNRQNLTDVTCTDYKTMSHILSEYLYRADKQSRNCFSCKAASECNWPMEKRNSDIFL